MTGRLGWMRMACERRSAARRQDVDGLRGLLIGMGLSGALWAGMLGMVQRLIG